jgi:hypothetical protein
VFSGYHVYEPVLGTLVAMDPTVPRSEASPFRRMRVILLDESGVQVIVKGCPGVRSVESVTEVIVFTATTTATNVEKTSNLARDSIV